MLIYNTYTRRKEEFTPIDGKNVMMYACGITVYDFAHIGHARQAIVYAMIAEYLRFRGYNVKYVRNYTDVDDKIIKKANDEGVGALDVSAKYIQLTEEDMANLHVKSADVNALASETIEEIIKFVEGLIANGHAYVADTGDVYYDVRSFPHYGMLSNRNVDEMRNGVRKDVEPGKRDPVDFALWKAAKPGEISWQSPWGLGRPGWHIECSAMVRKHLADSIDIHGGGKDLIFPHHENEIAQSEGLTGKKFVNYWSHCGLVKINGEKMSKSLGNSLTIRDALKKYNYEVIKYVMFMKHYTSDMDLLDSDFDLAERHLYYFYSTIAAMEAFVEKYYDASAKASREEDISNKIESEFIEVMDDDFNTALALSKLHGIFKYANSIMKNAKKGNRATTADAIKKMLTTLKRVYGVLGLFEQEPKSFISYLRKKYIGKLQVNEEYINTQINKRAEAKMAKDYDTADAIRAELEEKGIILMDSSEGTVWDIKVLYNNG